MSGSAGGVIPWAGVELPLAQSTSGFLHLSRGNLAKSASVEWISALCSMAMADRWASVVRLPAVRALAGVTTLYERLKAERGVLDFLDLLVKTRDALRDKAAIREHFQQRFRYLIIDEFQDTDPLQVQIARLLAGDRPGALVVVGDAKQSIYRFRRAEVRLFRDLAEQARTVDGGAVLHLTQNFRSRPSILLLGERRRRPRRGSRRHHGGGPGDRPRRRLDGVRRTGP